MVEANKKFESVVAKAKPELKLFQLLNQNKSTYLLFRTMQKWMRGHEFSDQRQTDNINNIQFAKEFFKIVDNSDTGNLNLEQLAIPLIALGLSSDSSFIEKVLKAINPSKFTAERIATAELSLREFTKIFRKDVVAERLTQCLQNLVIQRKQDIEIKKQRQIELNQRTKQDINEKTNVRCPVSPRSPTEETKTSDPTQINIQNV